MLEALKALSTFFVENSLRTRRNLRGDIERRSLAINEEFVSIFKEVKEVCELFTYHFLRAYYMPCSVLSFSMDRVDMFATRVPCSNRNLATYSSSF